MIDLEKQYHVIAWGGTPPLTVVHTSRNRHDAIAYASDTPAMFVIDTETGARIWVHPQLQRELRVALADAERRRRQSHNLALRYRARLRTTEESVA